MSRHKDSWYVRLPDHQVVKANSTKSVRHNIKHGQIPTQSYARRSSSDPWTPLYKLEAFTDLVQKMAPLAHRSEEAENGSAGPEEQFALQKVGVRGLLQELVTALESTLHRRKLLLAAISGLLVGLIVVLHLLVGKLPKGWDIAFAVAESLGFLWVVGNGIALISQLTFIELSQLRPAKTKELYQNRLRNTVRLMGCYLVVVGLILAILRGMDELYVFIQGLSEPVWVVENQDILLSAVAVIRVLLQVILLPVMGFSLLLGPIVIVEECSMLRALRHWWNMVMKHPSRLFFYEALVAAIGLVASLPFLLPVFWANMNIPEAGLPHYAAQGFIYLLLGLALTPAIAYLTVANVYLYLHLRYDQLLNR